MLANHLPEDILIAAAPRCKPRRQRRATRRSCIGLMLSICLAASLAVAGPLEDGAEAAERGDYATALRLWRQLADQGNPDAQYRVGLTYDVGVGARRLGSGPDSLPI